MRPQMHSRLLIGIPTFRRPAGLLRLLGSLASVHTNAPLRILVADNDPIDCEGMATVARLQQAGYRHELTAILVRETGLAAVRNALLDHAFVRGDADFLAMLDDDQYVAPDWVQQLMSVQKDFDADLVGGRVVAEFEVPPPSWIPGQQIYWYSQRRRGAVDMLAGAGNLLVARSVADRYAVRFDERFSVSGGEDKDFFVRLKDDGAKFAWAPSALAYEHVGRERLTRRWAFKRAFRIGCTDTQVMLLRARSASRIMRELVIAVAGVLAFPILLGAGAISPFRRMKATLMLARQFGKLAAFAGYTSSAYKMTSEGRQ